MMNKTKWVSMQQDRLRLGIRKNFLRMREELELGRND